jgi:cytochrome b561
MQIRNTQQRYGAVAQLLHWLIVVLIITQFVLAIKADALHIGPAKIALLARHKSIGLTIFALAVLRLLWRLINPVPHVPPNTPAWQSLSARLSHAALYTLILITPLLGWLMSSARGFSVSWFGLFTLPDFVAPDKGKYEFFLGAHQFVAFSLAAIAILHAAAALKHHFIDRDDVLRRMLPVRTPRD